MDTINLSRLSLAIITAFAFGFGATTAYLALLEQPARQVLEQVRTAEQAELAARLQTEVTAA